MKLLQSKAIAIGGGKGGVGKSFFASSIACALALGGKSVVLVDADLAGANMHLFFGIKYPEKTLSDYLKKKVPAFSDILLPTPLPGLSLICGASDLLEIANPHYAQKQKLINEIARLNADVIIIDIGAGASFNNLDFFNSADTGVIVATPSPPSLQNAYSFLKMAVHRKVLGLFPGNSALKHELTAAFNDGTTYKNMQQVLDLLAGLDPDATARATALLQASRYRLAVNMSSTSEGERVAKALGGVAYQYLNVHLASLGAIGFDPNVENSIRKMEPLLLSTEAALSDLFMDLAAKLVDDRPQSCAAAPHTVDLVAGLKFESGSRVQFCLHDEVFFQGIKLHVQTEDFGLEKAQIVTLVFSGGEILVSRKIDYREILDAGDIQHGVATRVKAQHQRMLADIRDELLTDELLRRKGP
jgi:flagellar biosynthesis protein FlhG